MALLASIPPHLRADRRVKWQPSMRPTAAPDVVGTVFLSRGRQTVVRWDDGRMQTVYTGALTCI